MNPRYAPAYNNLGWLYGRKGEFDASLVYLNRSIELAPDKGWAYFYRGYVQRKKGNIEQALEDTRKACRLGYDKACDVYEKLKRETSVGKRVS